MCKSGKGGGKEGMGRAAASSALGRKPQGEGKPAFVGFSVSLPLWFPDPRTFDGK